MKVETILEKFNTVQESKTFIPSIEKNTGIISSFHKHMKDQLNKSGSNKYNALYDEVVDKLKDETGLTKEYELTTLIDDILKSEREKEWNAFDSKKKLAFIWKNTHRDYKGVEGNEKHILVNGGGKGSSIKMLSDFTPSDIEAYQSAYLKK